MSQKDRNEELNAEILAEEEAHLSGIETILLARLTEARDRVRKLTEEYDELIETRKNSYYDMDSREHLAMDKILNGLDDSIVMGDKDRIRIEKLSDSPYFARIDFAENGKLPAVPWYIGRFGFEVDHDPLILDWRAPLSSMFYDYDTGPAGFDAPEERFIGIMTGKRQFQIRGGKIRYVVDTSQTVSDEILQEELSKTSDEKMKTIIATIQREQNAIIRNEKAQTMIIQGVAGSGKTSVALHRIAFLLYRFRNSIKAENVLIISPSKVFSDYISGVIPELGEEPVLETGFYDIAVDTLDNVIDFEDERDPLDVDDEGWLARAEFKNSAAFLELLKDYVKVLPERAFAAKDYTYDHKTVPGEWIMEQYRFYQNDPVLTRLETIADEVIEEMHYRGSPWTRFPKTGTVQNALRGMLILRTPAALYRDFFKYIGRPHMLHMEKNRIEWNDVFPFLYLWNAYRGLTKQLQIKHIVVDEMQDYSPVQYEVLRIMYPCHKTILGDFGQAMNPVHTTGLEGLLETFPEAEFMEMKKSFRSTEEIMDFACRIASRPGLETLDRHGEKPYFAGFDSQAGEEEFVLREAESFRNSDYSSLGIILKTNADAKAFYERIRDRLPEASLLSPESKEYKSGISVCSVRMAKGMEFDEVIASGVTRDAYVTDFDRDLLYIACTRAMHKLALTGIGEAPEFLQ
ncbi:MAG: AAA family ATPase [Lachnospiraceae bacterium]|nr:AAA family ATPase [Lachnospiraceae bacterium]